jgi:hypothetical protein
MISSAPTTVDRRWAMTSVVRSARDAVERVLNFALGVAVERRGRLVEHEDRRALEDGAGDGDALLLAAGELQAALADLRVVALPGTVSMKRSIWASSRGLPDLVLARVPAAIADVVADACR